MNIYQCQERAKEIGYDKALKAEFGRSFQRATASKPRPAPDAGAPV